MACCESTFWLSFHPALHELLNFLINQRILLSHKTPKNPCNMSVMTSSNCTPNIVTIVDRFSSFLWIKPLQILTTDTVTKYLMEIFIDFGYPTSILLDN